MVLITFSQIKKEKTLKLFIRLKENHDKKFVSYLFLLVYIYIYNKMLFILSHSTCPRTGQRILLNPFFYYYNI